ncbi:MAG: hypothetical protein QM726_19375 [Chitinophagaceae bacterium]
MKSIVFIALVFLSTLAFSQHSKKKFYKGVIGLGLPDTISCKNIVGSFTMGDRFEGAGYHFDSSMKFNETFRTDAYYYKALDSGNWTIKNKRLVLSSSKRIIEFDIIRFDKYYFFVLPEQSEMFLKEYNRLMDAYKKAESIKIDDNTTGTQHLAAWQLSKIFYSRKIGDFTGT